MNSGKGILCAHLPFSFFSLSLLHIKTTTMVLNNEALNSLLDLEWMCKDFTLELYSSADATTPETVDLVAWMNENPDSRLQYSPKWFEVVSYLCAQAHSTVRPCAQKICSDWNMLCTHALMRTFESQHVYLFLCSHAPVRTKRPTKTNIFRFCYCT
jgi:hypothetical protein